MRGLENVLVDTKWTRVNDKFNAKIKSGKIWLLSEDIIFWKLKILNLQNEYIHFQAIDQNFMVNYNTVRKIAVSISKAAVLVSARKPRHRFVALSIAINAKAIKRKKSRYILEIEPAVL